MKYLASVLLFTISLFVQANAEEEVPKLPTELPNWLSDEKAKLWAVDNLIEFMKEDKFYKIKSIKATRQFDTENKYDVMDVKLEFDDPSCKGREVMLTVMAPLCGDQGCQLFVALTDCAPFSSGQKIKRFMVK